MQVSFLLAHPQASYSMKRVAQSLCRAIPASANVRYVTEVVPALLHAPLPPALVHLLYVIHTRRILQKAARKLPPCDVLHVVDHSESFLLKAPPAHRRIISVYDLIPLTEKRLYRSALSRWLGKQLYRLCVQDVRWADTVVACSQQTAQEVCNLLGVAADRVQVVPLGVDTRFFTPSDEEQRRSARSSRGIGDETVVLHVGSNAPYKNMPTVLAVVGQLRQEGYRVRLVKVGEPFSPALWQQAEHWGISNCVHIEPTASDALLREWYQLSDVLLFPSLREGFGLPVLEALACGTPAVIADVPALNEWAAEMCLSAPPNDVSALSRAVLWAAQERRSPTYQNRLREFSLSMDWQHIARKYMAVYQR